MVSWRLVCAFVLILVLAAGLTVKGSWLKAEPATYCIRSDGSVEPSTTLITSVDNVTYVFTDDISGSIVVQRSNIVIDGMQHTLSGSGGASGESGFNLSDVNNVTVKNVIVGNFSSGFLLNRTSHVTISGNNITDNNRDGVAFFASSKNIILENNITGNGEYGIQADAASRSNTISANSIVGNGGPGVWFNGSQNNTVVGNSFAVNVWRAILLDNASNNTIIGNSMENHEYGLLLSNSSRNAILDNSVRDSAYGIRVHSFSDGNTVAGNSLTNNVIFGILLFYASDNVIFGNNMTDNALDGVAIEGSSQGNRIIENNISGNQRGISLSSSNNTFYHNNLFNNTVFQVSVTPDCANVWDDGYPSGGNYWSDYTGIDVKSGPFQNETSSDGIGDTAYEMNVGNRDNYPLFATFKPAPIAILSPENRSYWVNTDISLTFALNASASWIGYCLDGQTNVTIVGNGTLSGLSTGKYSLVVYANDTEENVYFSGIVHFAIVPEWDLSLDGKCDIEDINVIVGYFGRAVPPAPAEYDLTGPTYLVPDGKVNMRDIGLIAIHAGEHY